MANNRIYLRCKNCGDGFFLGKSYGINYYTDDVYYKDNFVKELNKFYEEHCLCNKEINKEMVKYLEPRFKKEEKHYENNFEIAYEFYYEENEDKVDKENI